MAKQLVDVNVRARKVRRAFRKFGYTVADLAEAWQRIGARMLETAEARVPVVSGALQRSLRQGTAQKWAVVRAGSKRVPYAQILEQGGYAKGFYGWHFIPGQHYLRSTLRDSEDYAISTVTSEVMRLAGVAGFKEA